MKTRAAAIMEAPTKESSRKYETIELELDGPKQDELLIRMVAAGLCHSDDHLATGDMVAGPYPMIGGHEGAGIVEEVGPHTLGFEVGDHVVFSFIRGCGRCRWCATGMQNLCKMGAFYYGDGGSRRHLADGTTVSGGLSAFSEYSTINASSAVKIDKDLPLDKMCLLSCAVPTGWGSSVKAAEVGPSDTVIIMGVGGIGICAVQGAANAGAADVIAVDPVAFKREKALELGATHAFATMPEAEAFAKSRTDGQGADSAIVTVGVVKSEHVGQAFSSIRKAGTVVVTGIAPFDEVGIPVGIYEMTSYEKRIRGCIYGSMAPSWDILRLAQLYRDGTLKIDELITNTYTLDQVAEGYEDMHAGLNLRGVVRFD